MSEKNSKDKPNLGSMGRLSPGETLSRARKEKGLAAEEIILHLGITQRTLNALEKDEYEALPSPLYVKGYIRRYCSVLNMSDTEVLADFDTKVKELGLVNKEPSIRLDCDSSRKNNELEVCCSDFSGAFVGHSEFLVFFVENSRSRNKRTAIGAAGVNTT